MKSQTITVTQKAGKSADGKKTWPAAKFDLTLNVPENEQDFQSISNGMSSFDFAREQYIAKAEQAGRNAFKNATGEDAVRISKAQEASKGYTLNSRGEGITTVAREAAQYESELAKMAPEARAAFEALLRKASKSDSE